MNAQRSSLFLLRLSLLWQRLCAASKSLRKRPPQLQAEAASVFESRGFSRLDAELAARQMWLSCRMGTRTPDWIIDKLKELEPAS